MVSSATSRHFLRTLDSARVAGIVAAILVNFAIIVALTMPAAPPPAPIFSPLAQAPKTDDHLHWVVFPIPILHQFPSGPVRDRDPVPECFGFCGSDNLTPIASPAPIYPIDEFRGNVSGTVVLLLRVGVDGHVSEARIEHGSGDRGLDVAARDQVLRNWRFKPVIRNGVPEEATARLPVVFDPDGR